MPIRERNAGVISYSAHNQVIADEQCIFHGAGRNYARLTERAVDEQECQRHPKPRNDFAPDTHVHGQFFFFDFFFPGFSLHVPPSQAKLPGIYWVVQSIWYSPRNGLPLTARDRWGNFPYSTKCRNFLRCHSRPGAKRGATNSPANPLPDICELLPCYSSRQLILREWAYPRRNSREKS